MPGPGVPALALRSLAGGADLPGPLALQQLPHRVRAGHPGPGSKGEHEGGGDAQDVGLPAALQELPQLGAGAVDLVPAGEVERQPVGVGVGEDVDRQLPLGPEPQVRRQACDQRLHRVRDVLGRDPLPRPDQRVPRLLPHVGQVHGVDPVRDAAGAAHVLAFHARRGLPCFSWPVSSSAPTAIRLRRDRRAACVQPGRRVPPDLAHRRRLVPRGPAQQPLRPVRRPVPGVLGDRPPVPRRQVAGQRGHVLARLQPRLRPGEARPQQPQQGRPLPHRPPGPYPGSSSRPCFICSHKLMISGRLHPFPGNLPRPSRPGRSRPNWRLPY